MRSSLMVRARVPLALAVLSLGAATGCGSTLAGSNGSGGGAGHGTGGSAGGVDGSQGHGGAGGSGSCTVDADCAAIDASWSGPSICASLACPCGATTGCQPGCSTDVDCSTGQSCGSDHHCAATACAADAACPVDFTCPSGHCTRKACTSDADCSGACVEGACYSMPGTCAGLTV
jgi:hypothetical protein